jgi:hypothetical protein
MPDPIDMLRDIAVAERLRPVLDVLNVATATSGRRWTVDPPWRGSHDALLTLDLAEVEGMAGPYIEVSQFGRGIPMNATIGSIEQAGWEVVASRDGEQDGEERRWPERTNEVPVTNVKITMGDGTTQRMPGPGTMRWFRLRGLESEQLPIVAREALMWVMSGG